MKKKILLILALVAGFTLRTIASHDLGGSLNYACVAPNTYFVTYSHYSWYSMGLPSVPAINLQISAPGCNTGRTIPMTFSNSRLGGLAPTYGTVSPYNIGELTAIVTFTPAEAACNNWVLSVKYGDRISGANQVQQTGMLAIYTEATLKLNSYNSSPIFDPQNEPILVANKFQPIVLNVGAYDPDGDSLSYRMVAPLTERNQPVNNYLNFPAGNVFVNPNPKPPFTATSPNQQFAILNPNVNSLSPHFPLMSYYANWDTTQVIVSATPYFILDSLNGGVAFAPMVYSPNGNNMYLVAFQVDEFRKINGVVTQVGSIRRETYITVGDAGGNQNPTLGNLRVNNAPVQPNAVITVTPGNTFNLQFDGADADLTDSVYLRSNATSALPGATFTVNNANRQSGTVSWTPTAAQVRSQPYYLRVGVKDNKAPFAGSRTETIAVRVSNSGGVFGKRSETEKTSFVAYPNPSRQLVNFRFISGIKRSK
jgi:hypothetical protein